MILSSDSYICVLFTIPFIIRPCLPRQLHMSPGQTSFLSRARNYLTSMLENLNVQYELYLNVHVVAVHASFSLMSWTRYVPSVEVMEEVGVALANV